MQVFTNKGVRDRDKQRAGVEQLTNVVASAADDERLQERTWVRLIEAEEGGWGFWGHALPNEELVTAARNEIAQRKGEELSYGNAKHSIKLFSTSDTQNHSK